MSDLNAAQRRLTAAQARKRRQQLGPPLQGLDDAALDALSAVSAVDMVTVEAMVRDAAGQRGVDLLRAKRA